MIKIAAVDDEYHALERLERMIAGFDDLTLCGTFTSGKELLAFLQTEKVDAVFLDIEMPETDGISLTERILELNPDAEAIFVTAFNQYAADAFEVNAVDYILKPISQVRFQQSIERLKKRKKTVSGGNKPYIQCFGEFEVFVNGAVMHWKNSKAKEILAYLIHKKAIPQDWQKISDAVWPDYDSEKAHANFHATTYLLRKSLAEMGIPHILECKRGNYRICSSEIECDLFQFQELSQKMLSHGYDEALFNKIELLHQGVYMEETGYEWAYPKAAELEQVYYKLLQLKKK